MSFEFLNAPFAMVKVSKGAIQERFNISTRFQWAITSGKEIQKYNDYIKFIEEWNYVDYHKSRWNLLRAKTLTAEYKNNYCNRIVHLAFS